MDFFQSLGAVIVTATNNAIANRHRADPMVLWRVCIAISSLVMRDADKSSASHKKHDYQSSRTRLYVYSKQLHDVASEGCEAAK